MKVTPYALVRHGAEPFELLGNMNNSVTLPALCEEICVLQESIAEVSTQLPDALAKAIPRDMDDATRRLLIGLRRDIFNGRPVKPQTAEKIRNTAVLTSEETGELEKFIQLQQQLSARHAAYKTQYEEERRSIFKQIHQNSTASENIKRGIAFTSHDLFNKYFRAGKPDFNDNKLHLSMLKYLSRTVVKTSPFSSFTHIATVHLKDQATEEAAMIKTPLDKAKPQLTINARIVKCIIQLLLKYPPFYTQQQLMLNSTLAIKDLQYTFLLNTNNSESIQRIAQSEDINCIIEKLKLEREIKFEQLAHFITEVFDSEKQEAEKYIHELIRVGLLEYILEIDITNRYCLEQLIKTVSRPTIDPHLSTLHSLLLNLQSKASEIEDTHSDKIVPAMTQLHRAMLEWYISLHAVCGLPEDERKWMVENMLEAGNQRFYELQKPYDKEAFGHSSRAIFNIVRENIFYEDVASAYQVNLSMPRIEALCQKFKRLYHVAVSISSENTTQQFHQLYFKNEGNESGTYPFLDFYEKIQLKINSYNELKEDYGTKLFHHFKRNYISYLKTLPEEEIVNIPLEKMEAFLNGRTNEINQAYNGKRTACNSMFLQFSFEHNNIKHAVVNDTRFFLGAGKIFSRFLYLLDDSVYEHIYNENDVAQGNNLYVENSDFSYFNANMHDPLMPSQLELSGLFRAPRSKVRSVKLSDLEVKACTATKTLELIDRVTQKKVYFYDLSFQSTSGRSGVFKLLQKFTGASFQPSIAVLSIIINELRSEKTDKTKVVQAYPRIMIDDEIVIQRKFWIVDTQSLQQEIKNNNDHESYLQVQQFLKKWNLPEAVFVSVNNHTMTSAEKQSLLRTGEYKPFYVHFSNPALVNIFISYVKKYKQINFKEVYPDSANMLQNEAQESIVSEFAIQWNS